MRHIFLLTLILIKFITNSYATLGQSCQPLPIPGDSSYILDQSVFAKIRSLIDMDQNESNLTGGCNDQPTNAVRFCIYNDAKSNLCDEVTINLDQNKKIGDVTNNVFLKNNLFTKDVSLHAEIIGSNLCVTMATSRGRLPLTCRQLVVGEADAKPEQDARCQVVAPSCYDQSTKSRSLFNFSGRTVQCLQETLEMVFFTGDICQPNSDEVVFSALAPFAEFQESLKKAIRAALIIYVIFYGFKLAINHQFGSLNHVVTFIMKFILVAYFAAGIGPVNYTSDKEVRPNGMTEKVLPFLIETTTSLSSMVYNGTGNGRGLCYFDKSEYEAGYEYYQLWDSIDCRIAYYLGMKILYDMGKIIRNLTPNSSSGGSGSTAMTIMSEEDIKNPNLSSALNFSLFIVIFASILGGNILIAICGLVFAVVFISTILYFISNYLVCLVTLYVLSYLSPIFITMALFKKTNQYFQSWLKLVISCTLQPMVIAGFIVFAVLLYDSAIFGNCKFIKHKYEANDKIFSTFELRIPTSQPEKCTESPGFKLAKIYAGEGWDVRSLILFQVNMFRDLFDLGVSMVYLLIFMIIFYFILENLSQFAADITGGASVASVTISPVSFINSAIGAAVAANNARSNEKPIGAAEDRGGGASGGGGNKAQDTSNGGKSRGGAEDKISIGEEK